MTDIVCGATETVNTRTPVFLHFYIATRNVLDFVRESIGKSSYILIPNKM